MPLPVCSENLLDDWERDNGTDFSTLGLGISVKYQSVFMQSLADLYVTIGDTYWVRHTLPKLAAACVEVAIGLRVAS